MANLTKPKNGDWTLDAELLVVTQAGVVEVGQESEIRIFATDAEGRHWDFSFGTEATEQRLEDLVGQTISAVVVSVDDELRLQLSRETLVGVSGPSVFDGHGLALDVAGVF